MAGELSPRALAIQTLKGSRAALNAALPIVRRVATSSDRKVRDEAQMVASWADEQVKGIDATLAVLESKGGST